MKKIIYTLLILLIFNFSYLIMIENNNTCQNTSNQRILLSCVLEKNKNNYKEIFENHYNFKFYEFDNILLEHQTDLFQKYYYNFLEYCNFDKNCKIDEKKFFMSKLICLTYSKACFLQNRFIINKSAKKIQVCTNNKCKEEIWDNLSSLIIYLKNCNDISGTDIFNDKDLQAMFDINKNQICKNISLDYYVNEMKVIKNETEKYYEFIQDSQLESLK